MDLSMPHEIEALSAEERAKLDELNRKRSGGEPLSQGEIDFRKKMMERATHMLDADNGSSGKAN